jgi:hypothetical protein
VIGATGCAAASGWLRLAGPGELLTRVLGFTGLLTVLPAYRSLPAAIKDDPGERVTG